MEIRIPETIETARDAVIALGYAGRVAGTMGVRGQWVSISVGPAGPELPPWIYSHDNGTWEEVILEAWDGAHAANPL